VTLSLSAPPPLLCLGQVTTRGWSSESVRAARVRNSVPTLTHRTPHMIAGAYPCAAHPLTYFVHPLPPPPPTQDGLISFCVGRKVGTHLGSIVSADASGTLSWRGCRCTWVGACSDDVVHAEVGPCLCVSL
jgi:hypothetical protein